MADQLRQILVPAAFARRDQAEAAIDELRDLGLTDEELGVAVPEAFQLAPAFSASRRRLLTQPDQSWSRATWRTSSATGRGSTRSAACS